PICSQERIAERRASASSVSFSTSGRSSTAGAGGGAERTDEAVRVSDREDAAEAYRRARRASEVSAGHLRPPWSFPRHIGVLLGVVGGLGEQLVQGVLGKIGRASCRERV